MVGPEAYVQGDEGYQQWAMEADGHSKIKAKGWYDLSHPQQNYATPTVPEGGVDSLSQPNVVADMTMLDIFMKIVDHEVASKLAESCNNEKIDVRAIYSTMAMRCILQGNGKPAGAAMKTNVLKGEYCRVRKFLHEKFDLAIRRHASLIPGVMLFLEVLSKGLITAELMNTLISQRMMSFISIQQPIALDHKMHKYFNRSALVRCVPEHSRKVSHWIGHVTARMSSTKLPITLGMYCHLSMGEDKGELVKQVWHWLYGHLVLLPYYPIVYSNEYYIHPLQMELCQQYSLKWMTSIDRNEFEGVEELMRLVKAEKPRFYSAYNPDLSLVYASFPSEKFKTKRVHIVSNVALSDGMEDSTICQRYVVDYYNSLSTASDEINLILLKTWWPYCRRSWSKQLDTYFFSTLLVNVFHLWKSASDLVNRERVSFSLFCTMLGEQILTWLAQEDQ